MNAEAELSRIREASRHVKSRDPIVCFFYLLMRNHLPAGTVEELMDEAIGVEPGREVQFCNGWVANHAKDIAQRFTAAKVDGRVPE